MGFIYNIEQEPGKFIAEASTIYKVNDPIVSEKGDNEKQNATPIKSWEEIDDSRTEEETEDSRKPHEHDTIIHLPKSGDTTCNWEESQKLTECEAVDPSKLAGEKENPDVHAIIVEEVSILHFISSDFKQERDKRKKLGEDAKKIKKKHISQLNYPYTKQ